MVEIVKRRRVTARDFDDIKEFVFDTWRTRQNSKFRKDHEEIWREVDRQVEMQPTKRRPKNKSGKKDEDWHNAIELGLMADALEILSADVLRLAFPNDRNWFHPHVELPLRMGQDGRRAQVPPARQRQADGVLRSLMAQQHADFGFRDRVKLSVKESLKHGSFVAEIIPDQMAKFHEGDGVEQLTAPTWRPHSMWNCWPDDSESIVGTDLIYRGTMIIRKFLPPHQVKGQKTWMNLDKVSFTEREDVELIVYYGGLVLHREDGEVFIPNRKTTFAEEVLVETQINDLAYSPILYTGYERDDIRDPYYSSPLIKRSPTARMASRSANKFMDSVDLKTEPPIVYEKHDSHFAGSGGPVIAPGRKSATSGLANFKTIETGDPTYAFQGLQFGIQEVEKGTGSNAVRQGVTEGGDRTTATAVVKAEQRGELRTVDFVGTIERQGLRPFLYMQHDWNLRVLDNYPFYNNEITTPDFMRMSKRQLPRSVSMEITGSKSMLGEEQRTARFIGTAQTAATIPQLAAETDWGAVAQQLWEEARVKDPERFVLHPDNPTAATIQTIQQQAQQAIGELQQQLQQAELKALRAESKAAQQELMTRQEQTDKNSLREIGRVMVETRQAEDRLRQLKDEIQKMAAKCKDDRTRNELQQMDMTCRKELDRIETAKKGPGLVNGEELGELGQPIEALIASFQAAQKRSPLDELSAAIKTLATEMEADRQKREQVQAMVLQRLRELEGGGTLQ